MTKQCFCSTDVRKIKVSENSRQAVICNPDRLEFVKVRVDGCLIRGKPAADWILSRADKGDVAIELKGSDVDHALCQIEATLDFWTKGGYSSGKLAALVVCSRYPAIDTKIQRAKVALSKKYSAPLHVVTRNLEYTFDALLSHRGPHQI